MENPLVVTICGSYRNIEEFRRVEARLERAGIASFSMPEGDVSNNPLAKRNADILHKRKIAMSDIVYVVDISPENPGCYIGESTISEITFANILGVPVVYHIHWVNEDLARLETEFRGGTL
jgi:hypothetical protein